LLFSLTRQTVNATSG